MTSHELFERAKKVSPGGVQSPVRAFKHVGREPVFFERAKGAQLMDVEGNTYTDFCMAFGPHLLGHCPKVIVEALTYQAEKATSLGACHPCEVELCETILKAYCFLDQVRLVNSGTEAVMTAIRLARGYTGRDTIVMFEGCYHGHSDAVLAKAGSGVAHIAESSSLGVPKQVVEQTLIASWDRLEELEKLILSQGNKIAAILIELIPANCGLYVPPHEQIRSLLRSARKQGICVIADEVITGFRVGWSGASQLFEITPDLVTLGKIIGGGLALAAVVGRREIMQKLAPEGPVYQAGTLSANALSVAAGLSLLHEIQKNDPYVSLRQNTQWFCKELSGFIRKTIPNASIRQVESIFWIQMDEGVSSLATNLSSKAKERYAEFFGKSLERGVYFPPSPYEVCFLSTAHDRNVLESVLDRLC